MAIKRIVVEVSPIERPFKEGETLFSYAERILQEENLIGSVVDVSARVRIMDVSTNVRQEFVLAGEMIEIEVRTKAMLR